jgi:hypothetical protein
VNPDAVIRGSRIWGGTLAQRARQREPHRRRGVEEFYRKRSLLKRSVLPEDVAEASTSSLRSCRRSPTGNVLNVDAGNATASRARNGRSRMSFRIDESFVAEQNRQGAPGSRRTTPTSAASSGGAASTSSG